MYYYSTVKQNATKMIQSKLMELEKKLSWLRQFKTRKINIVHFHLHVLLAIKYMIRNLKRIEAKRFTIEEGIKGSK